MAGLPSGYGFLADQLRRASSSIVLNFCEGAGKQSRSDRRKFFVIARGSANEVAATLDLADRFGVIGASLHREGIAVANELARMLSRFR